MSFGKKEMAIHIVLSASMLVVGAVATFLTRGDHDPDGFWYGYLLGANGAGIMAMVVGVVWLALAVSQRYLNMFSVDRRMGAEALLIVLAVIGLVSGVMIYMLVMGWFVWLPAELWVIHRGGGIIAVWLVLTGYVLILAVGFWWRWQSGRWKTIDVLGHEIPVLPPMRQGADGLMIAE